MVEVVIGRSFPGIQTDLGAPSSSPELHRPPFREPRRTANRAPPQGCCAMPETLPRFRLRMRLAHATPLAPGGCGRVGRPPAGDRGARRRPRHPQGSDHGQRASVRGDHRHGRLSHPPAEPGALVAWLRGHVVTAATMESTGIYWEVPFRTLEAAGIRADLVHAQHVKQIRGRKTDVADSLWLACICQYGLAWPSYVPPPAFSALRQQCRYRRKVVADRARVRQRLQKLLDYDGLRPGGVLTDILSANGHWILDGLRDGRSPERILAGLTRHVQGKRDELELALATPLDQEALWRLGSLLDDFDGSTTWLNELGPEPAHVFGSAAACAAWAGVCPGNNESAGQRPSGRLRPANPTLRATLAECAHGTLFQGYHGALQARLESLSRQLPGGSTRGWDAVPWQGARGHAL